MTGTENKKFVDAHTLDITKEKDANKFGVTTLNNALQKQLEKINNHFLLLLCTHKLQQILKIFNF